MWEHGQVARWDWSEVDFVFAIAAVEGELQVAAKRKCGSAWFDESDRNVDERQGRRGRCGPLRAF